MSIRVEHAGGCNDGCHGDDHLLLADETPAGGHDSGAVFTSGPVEREAATVPPAGPRPGRRPMKRALRALTWPLRLLGRVLGRAWAAADKRAASALERPEDGP